MKYYFFWEEAVPTPVPDDVADPRNDLNIYKLACSANQCGWIISNRNYFKPIQVTYKFRGQERTYVIQPLSDLLMLGFSSSAPEIVRSVFTVPYMQGSCVTASDKYPDIETVHQ